MEKILTREGNYTLRAYTNWQRNFGEDYIFTKNIYITGTKEQPWLVNVHARSAIENNKENIYASLAFTEADKKAIQLNRLCSCGCATAIKHCSKAMCKNRRSRGNGHQT